jgi:hypothetical protein
VVISWLASCGQAVASWQRVRVFRQLLARALAHLRRCLLGRDEHDMAAHPAIAR